jgi:hypothetical protein
MRFPWVPFCCLPAMACSLSLGATGEYLAKADLHAKPDLHVDGRVHPYGDENIVFGLDSRVPINWRHGGEYRLSGLVGYAFVPVRDAARWRMEGALSFGYGRFDTGSSVWSGLEGGGRLGFPLRLGPGRLPWQADDVADIFWMLVPEIGGGAVKPVGGPSRSFRPEAWVGLAIRAQLWSSLVP